MSKRFSRSVVFVGASRLDGCKMQVEVGDPDVVECRRELGLSARTCGSARGAKDGDTMLCNLQTIYHQLLWRHHSIAYVTSRTMAPFLDGESNTDSSPLPRFLVVGAGSRGNSYARALQDSGLGIIAAVADPIAFKRKQLGARYIWHSSGPQTGQDFADWKDFVKYETQRRDDEAAGLATPPGIDGAFICVLDHQHVEVASALGPLGLHIMCEKPLGMHLVLIQPAVTC
jgi:hypothetical protein